MTDVYGKLLVVSALGAMLAVGACGDEFVTASNEAGAGGIAALGGAGAAGSPDEVGLGGQALGGGETLGREPSVAGAGGAGQSGLGGESAGAGASATTPGYAAAVLEQKPLVYWRMGDVTDGVVADASGHGNDLILQGSGHALHAAGALQADDDGAIGFDGEASFAIATDARSLDFITNLAFTLECWARRRSGGSSYFQHLLSNVDGVAGDRNGYSLYLLPAPSEDENARSVFEYDRPAADLGLWGEVVEESAWGHYVAVFEGDRALLYVNGTLADSEPVNGLLVPRTGPFAVARSSSASGSFFKGELDEIAIYPRALTAKVIAQHYSFGK